MSTSLSSLLTRIGTIHNTSVCASQDVICKCLTTIREMLHDRGLVNIQGISHYTQAVQCFQDSSLVLTGMCSETSETTSVFFHNEDRVGVKQLRAWCEQSSSQTLIIVSLEGPTSFTRKETEQYERNVHFFTFKELCVNITRHALVPKHEKVNSEEKTTNLFLKHPEDLPRLYSNDKVSLYYDYQPGDIIKITRTVAYSEPFVYYRLVVPPVS